MFKNFLGARLAPTECRFFFIFCPNNSGKTVLAQYLAAQMNGFLPRVANNEGQFMPDVVEMMRDDPWNPATRFDWPAIRAVWQSRAKKRCFIESSPPNMMHVPDIRPVFGHDSTALLSICDPLQQIASAVRRYGRPGMNVAGMADKWLVKARQVQHLNLEYPQFPLMCHEDFVANPTVLNGLLGLPLRPFEGEGKAGSGGNGVSDLSIRTTFFLTVQELDALSARLAGARDVLSHFGYALRPAAELLDQAMARAPDEVAEARKRRAEWETHQNVQARSALAAAKVR